MANIGKFLVIDGTDGSGKATQTKLLISRIKEEGLPVETISFPQHGQRSAGPVDEYLEGLYGDPTKIDAKIGSTFYAVDRFAARAKMRGWLESGSNVVADRYVSANMGHQGSKIDDPQKRMEFFRWNDGLEYGLFGIPRPDLTVILHVPAEVSMELIKKRGNKTDGHETLQHLKNAEATYIEMPKLFPNMVLIECFRDGRLLSPAEIHALVWQIVQPLLAA